MYDVFELRLFDICISNSTLESLIFTEGSTWWTNLGLQAKFISRIGTSCISIDLRAQLQKQ